MEPTKNSVQNDPFLNEEYTINTPENVTFGYDVAGIGSRFIGALIDSLIMGLILFLLNFVIIMVLSLVAPDGLDGLDSMGGDDNAMWVAGLLIAIYTLLNFTVIWGYYMLFELFWRGQTPGKRVAKIRVVRMDGNSVGFLDVAIRNLVRIVDFLPTAYGLGLIVMFFNRHARRIGDYAAGTLVVHEQRSEELRELFAGAELDQLGLAASRLNRTDPADAQANLSGFNAPAGPVRQEAESSLSLGGATSQPDSADLGAALSAAMRAPNAANDPLRDRFSTIQKLSSLDFELVADILKREQEVKNKKNRASAVSRDIIRRTAKAMASKIDMEPPADNELQFLTDLAEAYRRYHR